MDRELSREELLEELTAQRQQVAELEAGEDLLQSILDNIGEGVAVVDKDGKFLVWNPMAEQILGMRPADTSPEKWPEIFSVFHPDKVTPFATDELPTVRALRGEEVDEVESFRRHPHIPEGIFVRTSARPLKDKEGHIQGSVVVFRDITRRRQAEEALRISERRLAAAVEASGVGIYDHLVPLESGAYHSERWAQILGYEQDQLPPVERFMDWLVEQIHADDLPRLKRAYADFIEGRTSTYSVEIRMRHKSGKWIHVIGLSRAAARDESMSVEPTFVSQRQGGGRIGHLHPQDLKLVDTRHRWVFGLPTDRPTVQRRSPLNGE